MDWLSDLVRATVPPTDQAPTAEDNNPFKELQQRKPEQPEHQQLESQQSRAQADHAASQTGVTGVTSVVGTGCIDPAVLQAVDGFWPLAHGASPGSTGTRVRNPGNRCVVGGVEGESGQHRSTEYACVP